VRSNPVFSAIALALAAVACASSLLHPRKHALAAGIPGPAYAANGDMMPPGNYREWVYLSTGLDMSYTANAASHSMFDNVFVNPDAYASFKATGTWPDKTVMVLEVREARDRASINQRGHFQGSGLMGMEVHVKDESRFPGKWAFFEFDAPDKPGKLFPKTVPCYSCHEEHGAVDTTFVQFYPTLMPIAQEKKTLSAAYLKEENSAKK
jgi:hypothetical protein